MDSAQPVGLLICGAGGHMGRRALCLLPLLRTALAHDGIDLRLLGVVDINPQTHDRILDLLRALFFDEKLVLGNGRPYLRLVDCLQAAAMSKYSGPVLVYDATAARFHWENLNTCVTFGAHYLGEKPLVMHRELVAGLRQIVSDENRTSRIFTDFIETQSLIFKAAIEFCRSERLTPVHFGFWREGPGGLKKLLDPQARRGVEGGALLDKGVHDLSILHGFVSELGLSPVQELKVSNSVLLPANVEPLVFSASPDPLTFMGMQGGALPRPEVESRGIRHEAADADVSIEVRARSWSAHLRAGWLGPAAETRRRLEGLGLDPAAHIGDVPIKVYGGDTSITTGDSRLCLITFSDNTSLLLDFLYKQKGASATSLIRLRPGVEPEYLEVSASPVDAMFGENSLGRVLVAASKAALGRDGQVARLLDESASVEVHSQLLQARQKSLSSAQSGDAHTAARSATRSALGRGLEKVARETRLRGVIFDLDNTIFRTADAVGRLDPLMAVIEKYLHLVATEVPEEVWKLRPADLLPLLLEGARQRGTLIEGEELEEFEANVFSAYAQLEVSADLYLRVFEGYRAFVEYLRGMGVRLGLVTTGVWSLQAAKIQAARVTKDFEAIVIDDDRAPLGKGKAFEAIARKWGFPYRNVLVVGDNHKSEIEAAGELGMKAIHFGAILAGEDCDCIAELHANSFGAIQGFVRGRMESPPDPWPV